MDTTSRKRDRYVRELFPTGVPKLWCPPLTHFSDRGEIDEARIERHLRYLSPSVEGLLVPGTTGEGWELSDEEAERMLEVSLRLAGELGLWVLVGVLKPSVEEMTAFVSRVLGRLGIPMPTNEGRSEEAQAETFDDVARELRSRRIAGFTFCAQRGADLSERVIADGLRKLLDLGLPSALYQLPQVTGNEISPQTAQELCREYGNLFLFKDSSGGDRLLTSGLDFGGAFFARGAEGDYFEWFTRSPRPYDGFLLSTANCFPRRLSLIVTEGAASDRARAASRAITAVINEAFNAVQPVGTGNLFTNANKVIDHFNAWGPNAFELAGPRLHDGTVIPREVVAQVGKVLERHDLLPAEGYLASAGS